MDVMLDLETLGKSAGCVVLSIGATCFAGKFGPVDQQFHAHMELESQIDKGLTIDPSTVMWWLNQEKDAQKAQTAARRISTGLVLVDFSRWYLAQNGEAIWANGSDFDLPILGKLYEAYGMPPPWKYNAGRCCRTVMALTGKKMGGFGTRNPLAHDAHADAVYQAHEISAALRHLSNFGA